MTGRRATVDGQCRHCDAELLWAWLIAGRGRRVPLEPAPRADVAPRYAVTRDHLGRLRARELEPGETPAGFERPGIGHLDVCKVLVARREAAASLRRAKRAAPNFRDPEELREALGAAGHHGVGR